MTVQDDLTPAQAYEQYFGPAIFSPLSRILVEHAAPKAGEHVLDVACGTGIVARRVAAIVGAAGRVVGVDVNPAMIAEASARAAGEHVQIEWHQADAAQLPVADAAFDLVTCQQGVQFFGDRVAGLREMRRALAEGGRLAAAVWQDLDRHPLYRALTEAELPHLAELGAPVTRADLEVPFSLGDADELRALFAQAGFDDIEVTSASIEASFATPERFVERIEFAYAAVVPAFAEDPAAFAAYLDAITRETKHIVERYREGDRIVVPMHARVVVARG